MFFAKLWAKIIGNPCSLNRRTDNASWSTFPLAKPRLTHRRLLIMIKYFCLTSIHRYILVYLGMPYQRKSRVFSA